MEMPFEVDIEKMKTLKGAFQDDPFNLFYHLKLNTHFPLFDANLV